MICKSVLILSVASLLAVNASAQEQLSDAAVASPLPAPGRNIISLAPLQITENGFGFGIAGERFLGKLDWLSFNLPLTLTLSPESSILGNNSTLDPMVYVMPGIKVYTNIHGHRKTKYSIGPSVVAGAGRYTKETAIPVSSSIRQSRFLLGVMGNVGANFFPLEHLYLGIDAGVGVTYVNRYAGENFGTSLLFTLSFKVGYRF